MSLATIITSISGILTAFHDIIESFPVELIVIATSCFGSFLLIGTYRMFKDW